MGTDVFFATLQPQTWKSRIKGQEEEEEVELNSWLAKVDKFLRDNLGDAAPR
jgi:hypothetical protein